MDVAQTTTPSPGQLEGARDLIGLAEQFDGRPPVSDQAMLAATQGHRALFLFGAGSPGGRPYAVGIAGEGELDLVVDPEHRGRGIGTAALGALLRAKESTSGIAGDGTAHSSRSSLKAWSHGENPAADALLAHAGFAPVRSLLKMGLDPAGLPAKRDTTQIAMPEGFSLRAFDPERAADATEWVRVNAAAFAAHPEQGRITLDDFAAMRGETWFDPADLLLLEGPNGLAGSTWIKTVPGPETELYAIGVDPQWAGRGLGRVLLDATLARMAQHDPAAVSLYVDGGNERAVNMYEAAGFSVTERSQQWKLDMN